MKESERVRQEVLELHKKRAEIERSILEYLEILKSNNVGMKDPLVDEEGYPRNDIDLISVRTARNMVSKGENDAAKLMREAEELLAQYYSLKAKETAEETFVDNK